METTLYTHQSDILQRNPLRHLLAFDTGTGKTLTALHLANNNCETCYVIVPKTLKEKWKRDIENFGSRCSFSVLTKEEFKKLAPTLPKPDGIIIDEGHYFAGIKSGLSKMMQKFMKVHNVRCRWILTATPYLSTPYNIFTLANILGHEWNYYTFTKKYFFEMRMGARTIMRPRSNLEKEMAVLVHSIGSVIAFEDMDIVTEMPEQSHIKYEYPCTKEQMTAIMMLNEPNFITRWTKIHTIENGLLYSDGYSEAQTFHAEKNDMLCGLIEEYSKIAIFCRYTEQINMVAKMVQEQFPEKKVLILSGATKNRQEVIDEANSAFEVVIIIQSQISAGYELPGISHIVFLSMSFSAVDYRQACGRFLRANAIKENTYYYLLTKGVDTDVYKAVMRKEDFTFEIYNKKSTL